MSWIRRATFLAVIAAGAAAALVGLTVTAASGADSELVKYYAVTADYQGSPENLTEIAARFLGDGARSSEVFNLNTGRTQPDGTALTEPAKLMAGWLLVLPWDAYGTGVQYGVLPDRAPAATPAAATSAPPSQQSGQSLVGGTGGATRPSGTASSTPKAAAGAKPGECAVAAASTGRSDWASLRLAADQAWPHSRGEGQVVAIVDSGIDGSLPQLTGHVTTGTDVLDGSGRGDIDCLGTGTAMAGLIAAQPVKDSTVTGIAPGSTVMPVRVAGKDPVVSAAAGAAGIDAAAAAGATVIAVGGHVDLNQTEVAAAVTAAVAKGVVVVVGAALKSVPVNPEARIGDGVLRVGGIGLDGQAAADYRPGGIDVVAPGVNVSSIGITGAGVVSGSGTHYAVAFVAGQVALVRSAYPELTPAQVQHRVRKTAESMGSANAPDSAFGWGLINPAASVTEVLPEEKNPPDTADRARAAGTNGRNGQATLLVIVALVAAAATVLLVFRIRRLLRADDPDDPFQHTPPPDGDDNPPAPSDRPQGRGSYERPAVTLVTAPDGVVRPPAVEPSTSLVVAGSLGAASDTTLEDKAAIGAKSAARSADE